MDHLLHFVETGFVVTEKVGAGDVAEDGEGGAGDEFSRHFEEGWMTAGGELSGWREAKVESLRFCKGKKKNQMTSRCGLAK